MTSTIALLATPYLAHGGLLIVKSLRNLWVPVRLLTQAIFLMTFTACSMDQ
ncbi:MAG: hypothetical protein AAF770_03050 [Bacteroidota bacterium]